MKKIIKHKLENLTNQKKDQTQPLNEDCPRLRYGNRNSYTNEHFFNKGPEIYPRYLVISPTDESKDITNVSIFKIFKDLKNLNIEAESVKKQIRSKTILIKVTNEQYSNTLLKLNKLCDLPVKITPHRGLNISKGVVKSVELKGSTKEEVIGEFKEAGVTDATNITIKKNGKIIHTNTRILNFGIPVAPTQIKLP